MTKQITTLSRLPNKCGPFDSKYSAEQMREYALKEVLKERERCCSLVFGMAGSDNVAQRTVDAILRRTP